jgi:Helix-turn-helix domain
MNVTANERATLANGSNEVRRIVEDSSIAAPAVRRDGFTMVPHSLTRDTRVSRGARLTYVELKSYDYGKGEAFPSEDRMASEMGCSRSEIERDLRELESAGWIKKHLRPGKTTLFTFPKTPFAGEGTPPSRASTEEEEGKKKEPATSAAVVQVQDREDAKVRSRSGNPENLMARVNDRDNKESAATPTPEQDLADIEAKHGAIGDRAIVLSALAENRDGVIACFQRACRDATSNKLGYFVRLLRDGEHLTAGAASEPVHGWRQTCSTCGTEWSGYVEGIKCPKVGCEGKLTRMEAIRA